MGAKSAKSPKIATIRRNSGDAHTTDTNKHVKKKTTTPKTTRNNTGVIIGNSDVYKQLICNDDVSQHKNTIIYDVP